MEQGLLNPCATKIGWARASLSIPIGQSDLAPCTSASSLVSRPYTCQSHQLQQGLYSNHSPHRTAILKLCFKYWSIDTMSPPWKDISHALMLSSGVITLFICLSDT